MKPNAAEPTLAEFLAGARLCYMTATLGPVEAKFKQNRSLGLSSLAIYLPSCKRPIKDFIISRHEAENFYRSVQKEEV